MLRSRARMDLLGDQTGMYESAVAGRVPRRRLAACLGVGAAALVSSFAAGALAAPRAAAETTAGFYPPVISFQPVLAPGQEEGVTCGKDHTEQTCGGEQLWTVPAGVNALTLYVDGGAGGAGGLGGGAGGRGGGVRATLAVSPGDTLIIAVGHNGMPSYSETSSRGGTLWWHGVGGWPGAGEGGDGACETFECESGGALGGGGGGGGYSEVSLLAHGEPQTALVVAPGGGGGGGATSGGGGKGGEAEVAGTAGGGGGGAGAVKEEPGKGGSGALPYSFSGDEGTGHNGALGGGGGNGGNPGGGGGGAGWSGGGGGGAGSPPAAGNSGGGGGGGSYYVAPTASAVIIAGGASVGEVSIGYGTIVEEPPKEEKPSPPKIETPSPNPTIVGEPVVGKTLKCEPGPSNGAQYTVTFQWLREGAPIGGATAQTYVVSSADAGHKLQCRVVETDAAGSANATSGFVSVGASASAGAIGVHHSTALVPVTCAGAQGSCTVTATLSVVERLADGHIVALSASRRRSTTRVLAIGKRTITLAHGRHATLMAKLNNAGMRLLARRHRVAVRVRVSQSTGAGTSRTLTTKTVSFTR